MSKTTKAQSKERRLKEKRARKAAIKARYQKYAEMGQNSKSKRFVKKGKKKKIVKLASHPNGRCGNLGCKKCFGISFHSFLIHNQPCNMPQWMYQKYHQRGA